MKILTMDTSSVTACVGVVDADADKVLSEVFVDVPLTHSQTALPMTNGALEHAGLSFDDVELLAVCNGPGSFTGVRIGVAAVKGLGFARDMACAPVSTLEALALNFAGVPMTAVVCAVMDARCRQVYTARFLCDGGVITRLSEDEATSIDDLCAVLKAQERPVVFVGDGAALCYEACHDQLACTAAPTHVRFVRARGMALAAARMAQEGMLTTASQLQPSYLRLPQAERELKARGALKNS